jgi:hypothetical protein
LFDERKPEIMEQFNRFDTVSDKPLLQKYLILELKLS